MSILKTLKKGVKAVGKAANTAVKTSTKVVKKIAKSPITKVGIAGACVVCPPAGLAAAAAVPVAAKLADAVNSKNKAQKAAATQIVVATAAQAKAGDKGAKKMLTLIAANQKAKQGDPKAKAVVVAATKAASDIVKRDSKVTHRFELTAGGRIKKVA